jgi:hypothetical protein
MRGHNTYAWARTARTLTFKAVSTPCKNPDDRNQPVVLTSEPWHRAS